MGFRLNSIPALYAEKLYVSSVWILESKFASGVQVAGQALHLALKIHGYLNEKRLNGYLSPSALYLPSWLVNYTSRFTGCREADSISRSATASEIIISLIAAIGNTYGA